MSTPISITDLFKDVAEKVNAVLSTRATDPFPVFFDYGYKNEVTRNLTHKDAGITTKDKKYPLIWLVMAFKERYVDDKDYYCELPDISIIIATITRNDSTSAQRIEANFVPRLYPIYTELLNQIAASGYFTVLSPESIPHEKIDRPYWGGEEETARTMTGSANLFNDFIDAIQIRGLNLFVNESVCDQFKLLN